MAATTARCTAPSRRAGALTRQGTGIASSTSSATAAAMTAARRREARRAARVRCRRAGGARARRPVASTRARGPPGGTHPPAAAAPPAWTVQRRSTVSAPTISRPPGAGCRRPRTRQMTLGQRDQVGVGSWWPGDRLLLVQGFMHRVEHRGGGGLAGRSSAGWELPASDGSSSSLMPTLTRALQRSHSSTENATAAWASAGRASAAASARSRNSGAPGIAADAPGRKEVAWSIVTAVHL